LARIGRENPDIDTLAADVKRATELIGLCRARLHKVEEEVSGILAEKD
jgi:exodeoxyribonuclease VII small subunit